MFESGFTLFNFCIAFLVIWDIFLCISFYCIRMGRPPSYEPSRLEYFFFVLFLLPFALFFSVLFVAVFQGFIVLRTPHLFDFLPFAL